MAKLIKGVNDLATVNPELAKQWNYEKNGNLKPEDICANSNKKVWWLFHYDLDDKYFDFEWRASIISRNRGCKCPYLNGTAVWQGFNDLATTNPELEKQWHPTKNGNLKPTDVTASSNKKVWWLYHYEDKHTEKIFAFEWEAVITNRNNGNGCPYLNGTAVWQGFNDLATTNPELAKQWHPTKNGNLKPTDVTASSNKKVWWYLPYDDEKTGKHYDFEWKTSILVRNQGYGCPYLSTPAQAVWTGFNDLATTNPKLAKQWHPTKNGNLKPTDVLANSSKKVWWLYHYKDENTRKNFSFEWEAVIANRNKGFGCPYLNGTAVWTGFNDLATINPELAKQWHPTKNGNLKPTDVTANSGLKVWWLLPYDDPVSGNHFNFEWQANITSRNNGIGCPYVSRKAVWQGFNDLATVNPELAKQWHPTKNGNLKPTDVTDYSGKKVWWFFHYDNPITGKQFDFEWQSTVANRSYGGNCPFLNSSRMELFLYDLLKHKNLMFKAEKNFKNCKDKNFLLFDIYLKNENIIIECDGLQHFENVKHFGGKERFKETKHHDNIKNNFCKQNNIPILRIPYTYDSIKDKQKIESLVLNFIKTKQVPQEILDFYSQHKFSNYVECVTELNKRFSKRVA